MGEENMVYIYISIAAMPVYIPTNSGQRFLFLHMLTNIYLLSL